MKLLIEIGDATIKESTMLDLKAVVRECVKYILNQKVGYVQVNFFKGGITTTNVYETKKRVADEQKL